LNNTSELAAERVARSRERLRLALSTPATPGAAADAAGVDAASPDLKRAWTQHPARHAAALLLEGGRTALLPTAQRHPQALLLGGFLAGALLVRLRPWRWATPVLGWAAVLSPVLVKAAPRLMLKAWLATR
jgi:hypothetical protein